jgi:hypothetical protein
VSGQETLVWTEPAWLEEAHGWIHSQLARRRLAVEGEIEQPHVRPWATTLRAATREGAVWFKASIPALSHEAALIQLLAARRPDDVPRLLARHHEHGWMLQADGGTRLRDAVGDEVDVDRWVELMARYAELQIATAGDRDAFLAACVPDRRLATLPARFHEVLHDDGVLRPGGAETLTDEELERLAAVAPDVERACERVASLGLPETIQHDDLHDANVLVGPSGTVFFDWGDASVSHPFLSLSVTLNVVAHRLHGSGRSCARPHPRRLPGAVDALRAARRARCRRPARRLARPDHARPDVADGRPGRTGVVHGRVRRVRRRVAAQAVGAAALVTSVTAGIAALTPTA